MEMILALDDLSASHNCEDQIFPCKKNYCTRLTSAAPAEGHQTDDLHQVESETHSKADTRAATC
jgi:hypothetical protein